MTNVPGWHSVKIQKFGGCRALTKEECLTWFGEPRQYPLLFVIFKNIIRVRKEVILFLSREHNLHAPLMKSNITFSFCLPSLQKLLQLSKEQVQENTTKLNLI